MYRYIYAILIYLGLNITTYISVYNNNDKNHAILMLLNNNLLNINNPIPELNDIKNDIILNNNEVMLITNNYNINEFTTYFNKILPFINDNFKTQRKVTSLVTAGYRKKGNLKATSF